MSDAEARATRSITSEGLSTSAVRACWAIAALLMGSGITATFVAGTGAAPAAMILFGSLFLVLALMKRVPLSLEVGGAKFDASYEFDAAYSAGQDAGLKRGVEVAISDVEKAEESGEPPHVALERRRSAWQTYSVSLPGFSPQEDESAFPESPAELGVGYRGPTACNAAGITYRQLDYWARTGLVEPGVRSEGRSGSQRLYSFNDIVMLRVIKRLLDAGVSLQQIRTVVFHLRGRQEEDLERITLISDGKSIYETTAPDEVIALLDSGRGIFGIALGGVARELRGALSDLPSEKATPRSDP